MASGTGPSRGVLQLTAFILANLQMCKINCYGDRRLEVGGCQRGLREKLADGGKVVANVALEGQFFSEEGGCKSLAGGVA